MLFMRPKEGHGSTRNSRAIFIMDAHMAAATAMHPPACGQPGSGTVLF
jgi:hypothetical protein